jgi:putative endonuclease
MFYVYVMQSLKDGGFYTGYSDDLKRRFTEHSSGAVISTRNRLPVKLVYYEASCNQQDALHREKYLKTAWGKRYVKTRLRKYLMGPVEKLPVAESIKKVASRDKKRIKVEQKRQLQNPPA